ncbi:MAG TPA: hypothetical protein VF536_14730, partial [Roseateles sp.]
MRSRDLLLAAMILACAGLRAQPVSAPAAEPATASSASSGAVPAPVKVAASAIDAESVRIAEEAVRADPLWAGQEKT